MVLTMALMVIFCEVLQEVRKGFRAIENMTLFPCPFKHLLLNDLLCGIG